MLVPAYEILAGPFNKLKPTLHKDPVIYTSYSDKIYVGNNFKLLKNKLTYSNEQLHVFSRIKGL